MTYAGKLKHCADFAQDPHYEFIQGSINDVRLVTKLLGRVEAVVNFAAESHVDNSIQNPNIFIETNVLGTQVLLNAARETKLKRFLQISTDEVYGDTDFTATQKFTEESPLRPSSPYAASKAAADLLCFAAQRTFGVPIVISRCTNNFGLAQHAEKLIPHALTQARKKGRVVLHGTGENIRDWLQVEDHCAALLKILFESPAKEVWNIGAQNEQTNLAVVKLIFQILGLVPRIEFGPDRPGNDRRYALATTKITKRLGWRPQRTDFAAELKKVVFGY